MGNILLKNIRLDDRLSDILITGGKIARIRAAGEIHSTSAPDFAANTEILDCRGKAAMPGFINMHTHAGMSLMRGIGEDIVFHDWIGRIWDIEKGIDENYVYWATKVAAVEMAKTGTTTFNDQYWFSPSGQRAACEVGINPVISYVLMDRFDKEESERQKDQCIRMFEEARSWNKSSVFEVGIHSVYTVSEELIGWAVDFARKNDLLIHVHVSETEKEVTDCRAEHGLSPVEYLDRLGVLGQETIAAHTLWVDDKDISILGGRGVTCVHNINSNLKLSSGYKFRYNELRDAGANLCLGTDGCASSNNLDMLEVMKTSAIVQKAWRNDPTAMPVHELIAMATSNAAKVLRINTGEIKEGYNADILIIDTENTFFLSPGPFLSNLIYSAHSDCIESVIAGGRFVMKNRTIKGEKEILAKAAEAMKTALCK